MPSTLDKEMYSYFTMLDESEKKSVIEMLKTFLKGRKQDGGRIGIEQYNKEIDEAMDRINKGDFTTLEELDKEMQSW